MSDERISLPAYLALRDADDGPEWAKSHFKRDLSEDITRALRKVALPRGYHFFVKHAADGPWPIRDERGITPDFTSCQEYRVILFRDNRDE